MRTRLAALLLAGALVACGEAPPAITTCEPERGIRPICGFQNPEDLSVLDDGTLLVSQMGTMDGAMSGSLAHFDPSSEQLHVLYPGGAEEPTAGWGDPGCPGPPGKLLSPHGFDLARRPDNRLALWVVNHGGRESVEIYEVHTDGAVRLTWRGCVIPPEPHFLNDVSALPGGGGFVATHMFPKSESTLVSTFHSLRGIAGFDTGYVLEWTPEGGFREVPGTAAPMPNGITTSPDGELLFINMYIGGEVRRVHRSGGEPPRSVEVRNPDNITWADDGRLLVASHTGSLGEMMGCNGIESGSCPLSFAIVAIDPDTLTTETVFENAGPPMGAATVAVQRGDELYMGTFAGDRIIVTSF